MLVSKNEIIPTLEEEKGKEKREIEEEKPLFRDSLALASTSWKELVVVEEGPVVA